ncbi:uncharacterized protein LOC144348759, partial [Saccoglossus kowalevskii]
MASSVLLFREIYPNGKDYEIYSFEIDNRLKPYFAAYKPQSVLTLIFHWVSLQKMQMLKDHTFEWIDKFYGEYHASQPTGFDLEARKKIYKQLKDIGVKQITWAGEEKSFSDFDDLYKLQREDNIPGAVGAINNKYTTMNGKTLVSIVVEIGMNLKAARLLVETLKANAKDVPLTLFVYGDFVEEHPELIKEWSLHYEIGIRGSSPMPNGLWELQNNYLLRLSIVSAMTRLMELKLVAKYVLPTGFNENVISVTKDRNLRPVDSTFRFSPKD